MERLREKKNFLKFSLRSQQKNKNVPFMFFKKWNGMNFSFLFKSF